LQVLEFRKEVVVHFFDGRSHLDVIEDSTLLIWCKGEIVTETSRWRSSNVVQDGRWSKSTITTVDGSDEWFGTSDVAIQTIRSHNISISSSPDIITRGSFSDLSECISTEVANASD